MKRQKNEKRKLITFSTALIERLEWQARKEERSVSSLIRWAVIQYLDEREE